MKYGDRYNFKVNDIIRFSGNPHFFKVHKIIYDEKKIYLHRVDKNGKWLNNAECDLYYKENQKLATLYKEFKIKERPLP